MIDNQKLKDFIVQIDDNVDAILNKIDQNSHGFVLVCDGLKIIAVLTDGDIRRALLKKIDLTKINNFWNSQFVYARSTETRESIISKLSDRVRFIPIVDNNGLLVDLEFAGMTKITNNHSAVFARAPARITFGGGGTDKFGFFENSNGICINAAIRKYARCKVEFYDSKIRIESLDYNQIWLFDNLVEFLNSEDTRLTIYQSLFRYLNIQTGLNIITSCDFPIGSGLGGSSALTTALLAAAKKLFNIPWSKLEIAKDAYKLERLSMKVAGGWQDQYASSIGGVNAILFKADSHDVLNINLNKSTFQELENSLYLCFSGISHDSSEVHKSISLSKQSTNNKLRKSAALAWQMLTILSSGKLTDFDKNINLNWRLKKEYSDSVSSVNLNETIDTFKIWR